MKEIMKKNTYKKPQFQDLSENEMMDLDGGTIGVVLVVAGGYTAVAAFMVVVWAACFTPNSFRKKKKKR